MATGVNAFNRMIQEGQADLTNWLGGIKAVADYISGDIKSLDDLQTKLNELNDTHKSDLELIAQGYEKVGSSAKSSSDAQLEAASQIDPVWVQIKQTIGDLVDEFNRLEGVSGLVSSTLSKVGENLDFSEPERAVNLITKSLNELAAQSGATSVEIDQRSKTIV